MRRALVLMAAGLGCVAAAQQSAPPQPIFKTAIDLTTVTATVVDKSGALVAGLARDAFDVFEDGERQEITQFTNERVPVSLCLLLDTSDSMYGQRIKDAESAVERFLLHLLAPSDAFFVIAFNHEPRVLFGWQTAADGVHEALEFAGRKRLRGRKLGPILGAGPPFISLAK
jgi:VWFA-related protein